MTEAAGSTRAATDTTGSIRSVTVGSVHVVTEAAGSTRAATDTAAHDLVRHVAVTTGLHPGVAERVITDVIAYFGETVEEFVRRRHRELHRRQYKNPQIWPVIATELANRPVSAPRLSERQLRRMVYG